MNTMLPPRLRSRIAGLLLYGLALLLVLLAPVLGVLTAAVAIWQALVAGSVWYMPIGLMLVLSAIAIVHSHKPFDLALLALMVVAVVASFRADALQPGRVLETIQAWAPGNHFYLGGLLLVMMLALVLIHAARRTGRW